MTLMGAIKQLRELRSAEDMPIYYKPVIAEVINVLLMDTQEVRHGHWVHLGGDEWCCSKCGFVVTTEGSWEHPKERGYDYCYHCGAKMDEVEDGKID